MSVLRLDGVSLALPRFGRMAPVLRDVSLDVAAGCKAFHSNRVIVERGWTPVGPAIEVTLRVGDWPASKYP